jgi:hypothetical protein
MSRLTAQRKLHSHGTDGNWRFKGLLLAALDREASVKDYAEAWPSPGKSSDYRFLSQHRHRDADAEMSRRVVAERGEDRFRLLKDHVQNFDGPKRLTDGKVRELSEDGSQLGADLDGAIKRTLFSASTFEEVDTLFREQLLETVMMGAEPRKIAREASNVINAETRSGDIPVGTDQTFAPDVSEGGEIRDDRESYATIEWDCQKVGQGARVTDEMVDHAMVDIIERQIEYLGASVENRINRVWLNETLDNANGNFDTNGSDQGVPGLNGAYGVVDEEDFIPDSFVSHPEYRTALFDDSNLVFVNRAGTDDALRDRELGEVMGITHYPLSGSTNGDTSETWGFNVDGEKGAVVYDSDHSHLILYNPNGQDIEVKDYEDPVRDLQGVNARIHVDAEYSQERAAATVQF